MGKTKIISTIKKLIIYAIPSLFVILGALCFGKSFYSSFDTTQSAVLNLMEDEIGSNEYFATNIYFGKKNSSKVSSYFGATYTANFEEGRVGQRFPVIFDAASDVVEQFNVTINGQQIASTAVANGVFYSSQENPVRLETVMMNLYKYRDRDEELSFDRDKCDGFIFIPDFWADEIIKINGLSSYDDLFTDDENNFVTLSFGDDVTMTYKIANVFHVNGFKEEYCVDRELTYDDNNYGQIMNSYLGSFCFISNFNTVLSENNNFGASLYSINISKKLVTRDYFTTITNHFKDSNPEYKVQLFRLNEEKVPEVMPITNSIKDLYFSANTYTTDYLFLALGVISIIASLIIKFLTDQKSLTDVKLTNLISIGLILVILLISQLVNVFANTLQWWLIFSPFFNATLVISLIVFVISFIVEYMRVKQR